VTRQRDPAWLSRWIREPDRMLAEKDPIAMALFERFDKIPMPNLRLDEHSAQSIIEFLQAETDRQQPLLTPLTLGTEEPQHRHAIEVPGQAQVQ